MQLRGSSPKRGKSGISESTIKDPPGSWSYSLHNIRSVSSATVNIFHTFLYIHVLVENFHVLVENFHVLGCLASESCNLY